MRSTYLLVCLLHEHWHVSKNSAAPFLKDTLACFARHCGARMIINEAAAAAELFSTRESRK